MLSPEERRRLDQIEQQLQASDPDLAERLTRARAARHRGPLAVAAVVVASLCVLVGAAINPALLLVLIPAWALAWIWLFRTAGRHDHRGPHPSR